MLNGDAARHPLEASGAPGDFTIWADPLHDGPVPGGLDDDQLRQVRARHLADGVGEHEADVLRTLRDWDAALARWETYDEVVFWFEHDLFDQLILIRHLDWLSRIAPSARRFSLICIGEHPDVPEFSGLGRLSPAQMLALLPARQPLTVTQVGAGSTAWAAFRADDPTVLERWIQAQDPTVLPFLPVALTRHLDELPGLDDGLSRSERQALRALAAGAFTFSDIFRATQRMEARVFMGDLSFRRILRSLASGVTPLLESADDRFGLTAAGHEMLAGRADNVGLNGIDRWMGGVHLTTHRLWRWDGKVSQF